MVAQESLLKHIKVSIYFVLLHVCMKVFTGKRYDIKDYLPRFIHDSETNIDKISLDNMLYFPN